MNCTDLERYLEAFLDGRLGRARASLLRRHVASCPACRHRVNALQEFERDLNKRLRAMGQCESIWSGLDLHLVSSNVALPPGEAPRALIPPPSKVELPVPQASTSQPAGKAAPAPSSAWASRTVGLMFLVAAGGAVVEGTSRWLADPLHMPPTVQAQLDTIKTGTLRELRSTDPMAVQAWLGRELGAVVPLPPEPADFRLIGTHVERLGGEDTGVLTYRRNGTISQIFMRPSRMRVPTVVEEALRQDLHGRARSVWTARHMVFALTSPVSPELYEPLIQARWTLL